MSENTMPTSVANSRTGSWAEEISIERSRTAETERRHRTATLRAKRRVDLMNLAVVTLMLLLTALTHAPVFGDLYSYVTVAGGVLLGIGVAVLARTLRLGALLTSMLVFVAYIAFGGVLALPSTTLYGVIPTTHTIRLLVVGVVSSWKDLLTVEPPASVFVGPNVMPYITTMVLSCIAGTIVLRTKRQAWALLPVALVLLTGILWGSQHAPFSPYVGVIVSLIGLLWSSRLTTRRRHSSDQGAISFSSAKSRYAVKYWLPSVVMILIGVIAAAGVNFFVISPQQRTVLRDYVEPPLNLREYHSPVVQFRHWNTTDKDATLMTVSGLQERERVRLATLDNYDGTVFRILGSESEAGFRRVGEQFTDVPLMTEQHTHTLSVTIKDYVGHWVPGVANTRRLTFDGAKAPDYRDVLHYGDRYETALTTKKLQADTSYTLENIDKPVVSDDQINSLRIAAYEFPADTNVPQIIAEKAAEFTAEADAGVGQIRAIEQRLKSGYYSDGSDGLSLPGHRADRLEHFLTQAHLVGDDDQYAPTMALMLRSLGIPSRLVVGFHKEGAGAEAVELTGKDAHMWVEVPFEGAGWLPFDPTPPRDQVPQTEKPKPKPNPTPQVLQPPEPPDEPAEAPAETFEESEDEKEKDTVPFPYLKVAAYIAGGTLLLLSPIIVLALAKALRRHRRRKNALPDKRLAGAWDEVVDQAADLGIDVPLAFTRRQQARTLDAVLSADGTRRQSKRRSQIHDEETVAGQGATASSNTVGSVQGSMNFIPYNATQSELENMAAELDAGIFGESPVSDAQCDQAWKNARQSMTAMKKQMPWYRRLRSLTSARSLRRRARMRRSGDIAGHRRLRSTVIPTTPHVIQKHTEDA